jgi:cysteine desulfurase/selenocysteine lyase
MNAQTQTSPTVFDVQRIRADFPLLSRTVHDKPLIYFDNANTSQKPASVIEAVDQHYRLRNANVSRAVHLLGEEATAAYEGARDKLARFINATSRNELILTSGTTQAMNMIAYSFAMPRLKEGDSILTTVMEHHANIVPWQIVASRTGATVKAAPIDDRGELIVEKYIEMLTPDVKLACVTHVSNVLGTVNPVREIARECRKRGIPLVVDGSQAVPHRPVDVQALGCDFYAFTGHKMLSGTTFAAPPHKFEAGTPNIAGFAGVGAAIDYYDSIGFDAIHSWEQQLLSYATERLRDIPGLRLFGEAKEKEPVISFLIEGAQATDLATLLDLQGVAVRSGHHCAHPLMQFFKVPATLRASLAFYNTREEVDAFITALLKVRKLLM